MTTMIERVARAIEANKPMSDWPTVDEVNKQARAAIEAMRVPTDVMSRAAHSGSSPGEPNSFYEMWDYAIDAALNEKES